ncbi:MAG: hypothetical protein K6L76_05280 [Agarilytica sp.]
MSMIKVLSVKVLSASALVLASSFSFGAEHNEVKAAQEAIDEYRLLRRACSITQGEQRRVCFSQLSAATEDYKKAKKVLASTDSGDSRPLIGQAQ